MSVMVTCEMFEMFAPVLYVSRIFCLQPLQWKKSGYNYIIAKSGAYVAYSNIIIVFFVIASIYGLSQVFKLDVVYLIRLAHHTERYVTFSDVGVVLVPSLVGVVTTSIKADKYVKYFEHLRKFDNLLQKHPPKSWNYYLATIITMSITFLILIFDLIMWIRLNRNFDSISALFAHFLPYYVCYSFTMVMELVYWQSVYSIKVRITLLNEKLSEFIDDENDLFMRVDKKKISNVVDTLKVDETKKETKNKKTLPMNQVHDLIKAYQKLTEATNSVNDCYGLVILIVTLGCLIHLLVTPYALYSIIFNTGNSMFIVSQSIWMTGHVSRLFFIVEPCHGCLVENKNTSALVCKLLCLEWSNDVKKSLEFFLSYLAQCKIEFTAFGLTKINRGLLTTIAGAVTTYLVILFQFNKS